MPYTGSPPTFSTGEKTGIAAKINQLRDAIRGFTDPWTSYTPTLTASTTNPTGWTQTGYYMQVGKLVAVKVSLIAGAGMTAGVGSYSFALPVNAGGGAITAGAGQVLLYRNTAGATFYAEALPQTTKMGLNFMPTWGGAFQTVTNTAPWTWAANDLIRGTLLYEAA